MPSASCLVYLEMREMQPSFLLLLVMMATQAWGSAVSEQQAFRPSTSLRAVQSLLRLRSSGQELNLRLRGGSAAVAERVEVVAENTSLTEQPYNQTFLASTAGSIAAFRAAITALNSSYIDDPYAFMFARETNNEKLQSALSKPPAELARLAVRTYFFDNFIRDAVFRHGIRQVVLIGAGFDARALRGKDMLWHQLDEPKAKDILEGRTLTFYEIDLPELIQAKAALLAKMGMGPENARQMKLPKVHRIGADVLKDDWVTLLRRYGFRADRPACVVMEGLLYYFDEADVNRTLATLSGICAGGSRVGLSAVTPLSTAQRGGRGAFRWGTDEPEDFLRAFGWAEPEARELGDPAIANGYPLDQHPPPPPRGAPGVKRTWYLTATRPHPPKGRGARLREAAAGFLARHRPAAERAAAFVVKALTTGHQLRIPLPDWLSLHH